MTSLLAITVRFLVLSPWLIQQVTGQAVGPAKSLDLSDNAFDDQYEGCTEEMEKKAPQLLKEELEMNTRLKYEWKNAEEIWKKRKNSISNSKQLNDFHGTALVAYTGSIAEEFNTAVREFGQNSHNFHFKAFHYYLTRALQLLTTGNCYTVHRGTRIKFYYSGGGNVRLGQFASSSLSEAVAHDFRGLGGTLFTIRTCSGVYIQKFSLYPNEKEVLIPVNEVYQKVTIKSTDKKYTEISLESPQKMKSNFNCFYSSTDNQRDGNFNSSGMNGSSTFLLLVPGLLALWALPDEL